MRALGYLHQLLTSDSVSLAVEHLLASVGAVLQQGPRVRDIACGGMAGKVREIFASVMHAVVDLASKQPAACINTIAMLCIVPYTRCVSNRTYLCDDPLPCFSSRSCCYVHVHVHVHCSIFILFCGIVCLDWKSSAWFEVD